MAITNASRLADFGTGIGTEGAIIQVDNTNARLGIGTTNPQAMLQVGTGVSVYGNSGIVSATAFYGDGSSLSGITGGVPGVSTTGHSIFNTINVSGIATFGAQVSIADSIVHTGDTNTAIRFPSADTFTVETGGSERLRIDSSGGTVESLVTTGESSGVSIKSVQSGNTQWAIGATTTGNAVIYLDADDGNFSGGQYCKIVAYRTGGDFAIENWMTGGDLLFKTENSTRLTIDSAGAAEFAGAIKAGGGIYLSDAGSTTAAANHLGDYEEGDWTPALSGDWSNITYTKQRGRYIKIGLLVYLYYTLQMSAATSPGGSYAFSVNGVPFPGYDYLAGYFGGGVSSANIDIFQTDNWTTVWYGAANSGFSFNDQGGNTSLRCGANITSTANGQISGYLIYAADTFSS
jgi:hypothetical protein